MSNEYKDWYNDLSEDQRVIYNICMDYPFLIPRNIEGNRDEKFDYQYLGLEIPDGWFNVFLQLCSDIKPVLEKEGLLDDFYFLQVKEKYNNLRCYTCNSNKEVDDIIYKYESMSEYICTKCGAPATCFTDGYWASYCDECKEVVASRAKVEKIEFKPHVTIRSFGDNEEHTIYFEEEWNRYLKENGYDKRTEII